MLLHEFLINVLLLVSAHLFLGFPCYLFPISSLNSSIHFLYVWYELSDFLRNLTPTFFTNLTLIHLHNCNRLIIDLYYLAPLLVEQFLFIIFGYFAWFWIYGYAPLRSVLYDYKAIIYNMLVAIHAWISS